LPDFALLVVVDTLTRVVDYSDRSSAVLFGDGAAAAVVSLCEPGAARVEATSLDSDPSAAGKVVIPTCGHFAQEGRAVQMFAIRKTVEGLERLRTAAGDDALRPLHLVGHQANLRALETARERSGMASARHHTNVEYHGNTGAPGAPSVVSQRWEKWGAEDDVALVGVGAGLSWGGALLRFEGSR
jgi:3-oxoacyl-[acyl-carrier-protein] synthase-3